MTTTSQGKVTPVRRLPEGGDAGAIAAVLEGHTSERGVVSGGGEGREASPAAASTHHESPDRSIVPWRGTYDHTFAMAGRYDYVCILYVRQGR